MDLCINSIKVFSMRSTKLTNVIALNISNMVLLKGIKNGGNA